MKRIMHVPHELIIQILLRLPVKSLIRFKCVRKLWFSLISNDSNFANSDFQLTAATHNHRILFISTSPHEFRSIDLETSLDDDSASASLDFNFMLPQSCSLIEVKYSCRGFMFWQCFSNIYLWNPSTGVHKQIPLSPIDSNLDAKYSSFVYGFGYDPSMDDYLVFNISTLANISSHLEFFSLRSNTWKEIECPGLVNYTHYVSMNALEDRRVGLLFKEAIHWLTFRHDSSMDVIVAFHLVEQKLLEIYYPDEFYHEPIDCDLWVFREFFSLWAMEDDTVEIWVMNDYTVHSSWTKTLVLSIAVISTQYFSPICCTRRGEIIGIDGGTGLVKYDEKGHFIEHRSYCNHPCKTQVAMYTESLLSLPCDDEQA
ncbi:F-box/kelch-repeat protein At3g06240-like [Lathyrus oleraceus]|uniref:F-box/kelch-repeat protein At3g06240-like n=1 Tax=Pisum sativum TaxID=3888 RepID=UPI0021D10653|nr:F-box/kelch-repeat protein At3g06240-like [Pisum sativum]